MREVSFRRRADGARTPPLAVSRDFFKTLIGGNASLNRKRCTSRGGGFPTP